MISRVVYRHDMTNKKPDSNEQNTHEGICQFDGHESSAFRIEGGEYQASVKPIMGSSFPVHVMRRLRDRPLGCWKLEIKPCAGESIRPAGPAVRLGGAKKAGKEDRRNDEVGD